MRKPQSLATSPEVMLPSIFYNLVQHVVVGIVHAGSTYTLTFGVTAPNRCNRRHSDTHALDARLTGNENGVDRAQGWLSATDETKEEL